MQDYMNAVGETVALTAEELAAFKDVQNIEGYVVDFDTEKVIGVVFEKDGLITKLTIHDNDEQDLTDAMLNMAATISKNNNIKDDRLLSIVLTITKSCLKSMRQLFNKIGPL